MAKKPKPPESDAARPDDSPSRAQSLLDMLHGSWRTQAICTAAELRIAELLADGPRSSEELAAASGAHPPSLHRLLRALTTLDVCRQLADGRFQITPTGSLLASDHPESLRHWVLWWGKHLWPVWQNLVYSLQTGQSARNMLLGTEGFEHLERDPEAAAVFHDAMAELTRLTARAVVAAYDFSRISRIVDVGGGYGQLLSAILIKNPAATGVLFDGPHAIEQARRRIDKAGLASRCQVVGGDFFQSVPAGADAYMLKSVLHDFDDEKAGRILANCRRAMGAGARLLIIERLLADRPEVSAAHESAARSDLNMLVATGGRERTETELTKLLESSGFEVRRVITAGLGFSVVEAMGV